MNQPLDAANEWMKDSKWMKLLFATAPPGWVGIVWEGDRLKIVAAGEDEESTRMAARTSGYGNAVLIQIPAQPSASKQAGHSARTLGGSI